jgi:hypothetical protein
MNSFVLFYRKYHYSNFVMVMCLCLLVISARCEAADAEPNNLPKYIAADPRPFTPSRGYVCQRADGPIVIDGKLDEPAWQRAARTESFVDIQGQMRPVAPRHETHARMLWDDSYFYVGARLEEPHVWGTITERNAVIFHDNDFEVFIDPDGDCHDYYEFEVNALNTVWNLYMDRPYKHGGNATIREMPGQLSQVHVKGTLNDTSDRDAYWSVEIAFPWAGMTEHAGCPCPPRDGDIWRVGFSRVQWHHRVQDGRYLRIPARGEETDGHREDNWIWSPQGVINMHRPETWARVQFSTKPAGSSVALAPDPAAETRYHLVKVLYAQEAFRKRHGSYAKKLEDLDLTPSDFSAKMTSDGDTYRASMMLDNGKTLTIQYDGRLWVE